MPVLKRKSKASFDAFPGKSRGFDCLVDKGFMPFRSGFSKPVEEFADHVNPILERALPEGAAYLLEAAKAGLDLRVPGGGFVGCILGHDSVSQHFIGRN